MSKKAFSLIELSIVVLVIAIIIAGVTQSSSLLAKAKLQSAQTATKNSPVSGTPDLLMWFETTLDESFATTNGNTQNEDGAAIDVWNDINPQSSQKLFLINYWGPNGQDEDAEVNYSKVGGPNGLPSIHLLIDDGFLSLSTNSSLSDGNALTAINASSMTIFAVYLAQYGDMSFDGDGFFFTPNSNTNDDDYRRINFGGGSFASNSDLMQSTEIASITSNGSNANLYINGANEIDNADASLIQNNDYFEIWGNNFYFSEFIVFDRVLKDVERQAIEQYLGKKYGVSVAKQNTPTL
jgi:prepilin-type N-terminal cleavage/methylation domain-containing protein